jgi:hypothetical protein
MTALGILGAAAADGQHGAHATNRSRNRCLEDGTARDRVRQLPGQLIKALVFHPRSPPAVKVRLQIRVPTDMSPS